MEAVRFLSVDQLTEKISMAEQFKPYNVLLGNKIDFPPFHRKYKKKIKKNN